MTAVCRSTHCRFLCNWLAAFDQNISYSIRALPFTLMLLAVSRNLLCINSAADVALEQCFSSCSIECEGFAMKPWQQPPSTDAAVLHLIVQSSCFTPHFYWSHYRRFSSTSRFPQKLGTCPDFHFAKVSQWVWLLAGILSFSINLIFH